MKTIPYLDGWRGVAILLVLIDHFLPHRYWYPGKLGVELFFVLSGLFMGRLLFIKKVPLSSFFAKRFSRIIPTFWVYVAAMWIYATFYQPKTAHVGIGELASILTFTSTYFLSLWEAKWPIGQLWSLNVEEHSYVYLAIGAAVIARARGKISASGFLAVTLIAVCLVIVLYMCHVLVVTGSPWRIRSEVACIGLMASAAICVWREQGRMNWIENRIFPLAALAIGIVSFRPRSTLQWNFMILVAPILFAFAVNYASTFPEILKRLLSLKVLRWFGTCSFSIYLWQGPFYDASIENGAPAALCLLGSLIVGALSFYLIENPTRIYLNRKWDERNTTRSAPSTIFTDPV